MKKTSSPCHKGALRTHSRKPLRYRCSTCNRTYAARHGELSFGSKLTPKEILTLLAILKSGTSIRKTAQIMHLSPSTVERWKQRFLEQKLLFNSFTTPFYEYVQTQ